ncbi:MAG: phosphate-starvation-inducible PsiE family protein [Synechococcus sp.]|nr:phosphate-starvation-inducible PsiE family protein [Synechococcus sp.]
MNRKRQTSHSFLSVVDSAEREVARILTLITGVVIISALVQLVLSLGSKLLTGSEATWLGDDLIKVLGDLLTVLIALEVLQNITSYLRRHVVQIELVLVTALTAVARKVIVLPTGAENKPQLLVGLGIAVVSLSAAYWLVKRANATPTRAFQERDQSVQRGDVDAAKASLHPQR